MAWFSGCGIASRRRPTPVRRREWMTARAAAHQVLAARGSTVALYDLRETIETWRAGAGRDARGARRHRGPKLPRTVAAAYARASDEGAGPAGGPHDRGAADWWRTHLATVFRAVAAREKLTERHALTKRIRARWPGRRRRVTPRARRSSSDQYAFAK